MKVEIGDKMVSNFSGQLFGQFSGQLEALDLYYICKYNNNKELKQDFLKVV